MASVIAHELDQPLTAIVSNAEAARYLIEQPEPDTREAVEALHDVIDSAMRAAQIIQRERRLLRKSPQTMEQIDLNETIREIELFLRAEAKHRSSRINMELTPGLLPISGDQVQLQQVLLNLARNGLQAMNQQPVELRQLTIDSGIRDGEVVVRVIDAGPPIDDATLQRMFEPFYTTKPSGLGMGLPISRSILDAHHARIWATRNPAGGVTMSVAFPLASRKDANDNSTSST
jgi:C4-dicarboxylate-specific signal transduction histidine kinase